MGFDWRDKGTVMGKVREELGELERAMSTDAQDALKIEEELGDLIFTCVNLARHCRLDAEEVAHKANQKFERRFAYIERCLAKQGKRLEDAPLAVMEQLWRESKKL